PVNFFERNPALDVPPSEQGFNKSVQLAGGKEEAEGHMQPSQSATVGEGGEVCCNGERSKL
ncbi:hypothetical protein LTS18_004094, partial [Coniosporium uncinatum]